MQDRIREVFVLILAMAGSSTAQAEVYQCQKQGVVMFSQFPCDQTASVQLDVKSGTLLQSRKADQQLESLHKKSRFLEYQHLVVLQQKNQQLRQMQQDLFRAQRRGDASEYVTMMQQRAQKTAQELRQLEQQQQTELFALQKQISQLEQQYASQ